MEKRGQVTIYVIIAIVIVGVVLLGLFFRPQIEGVFGVEFSPQGYLSDCIEPELRKSVFTLSQQGGYTEPEGTHLYQGDEYKYLCYTDKNYETCVVQQPAVKNQFENDLEEQMGSVARRCFNNLKSEYEQRGYSFSGPQLKPELEIIPGSIRLNALGPVSVSKGEERQSFDKISVALNSEMYGLLFIAHSIVEFESTYGDSETLAYLQYYPDLSINKIKLSDGTTIYKISNVITGEEFRFASRSLIWPAGYGLE